MRRTVLRLGTVLLGVTLLSACNLINSFQGPDDKTIVADIQSKLFQDPVLKTRNIQVVSQKGVVVLTGTVGTDLEKAAAERLAGESKGVKQVINQLNASGAAETSSAAPGPAVRKTKLGGGRASATPARTPATANAAQPGPAALWHAYLSCR